MKKKTTSPEQDVFQFALSSGRSSPGRRSLRPSTVLMALLVAGVVSTVAWPLLGAARTRPWRLISYNVQNLFDADLDGGEFEAFRPEAGYDARAYWSRLDDLSLALRELNVRMTDVLVLIEVENTDVVRELTGDLLPGNWHVVAGEHSGYGTQVAVASRAALHAHTVHAATELRATHGGLRVTWRSRDAIAVRLYGRPAAGDSFLLYAAHWKSQRGNPATSARYRILEARLAAGVFSRAGIPGLLVGDLNEDPRAGLLDPELKALVPAGPGNGLRTTATWPDTGAGIRYQTLNEGSSPEDGFTWLWSQDSGPGSYVYRGVWQRLDHAFLFLPEGQGVSDAWTASLRVPDGTRFTDPAGIPLRYDPRTGRGLSDHLPILVSLARRPLQ